jgi:hypothetical protein
LEGDDREQLLNWTKAYVEKVHSDMQLTEEQIRQMAAEGAYDARGKVSEEQQEELPDLLVSGDQPLCSQRCLKGVFWSSREVRGHIKRGRVPYLGSSPFLKL